MCAVDAQRAQKGGLTHTIWNSFTKEAGLKVNAKGIKKDRRRESGFWEDWSEELSMLDLQVCTTSEGLPRWQSCKEPTCHHRRSEFDLWVRKIPWNRKWQLTQYSYLENFMDIGAWRATHAVARVGHDLETK